MCVLYTSIAGLPVPFAPVHLLFINLLTDSLPAIAIGMEPANGDLLRQKPRDPTANILNGKLMGNILVQGTLIAVATMAAFYIGFQNSGAALASTMAFSTLTLARLFHGFNCRGARSIFQLGFFTNVYSILALYWYRTACTGTVPSGAGKTVSGGTPDRCTGWMDCIACISADCCHTDL